jgi:hypothetical protein
MRGGAVFVSIVAWGAMWTCRSSSEQGGCFLYDANGEPLAMDLLPLPEEPVDERICACVSGV